MTKERLKYIDLFSGIGGFRQALELLAKDLNIATQCVAFSEIDKYAITSYKANYNTNNEIELGDIELFVQDTQRIKDLPDFDIVFGGFPCQPFSMMGKQLGLKDERGGLFFSVMKLVDIKKPKYILLENVRNLYTHDKGSTYQQLKNELEEHGYTVQEEVLNTSDFGLPQHRRRLYIFASRKDLSTPTDMLNAQYIQEHFSKLKNRSINTYLDVMDGILDQDRVEDKYYLSEKIKPTILSNGTKNFKSNSQINQLIARPLTATMVKMHRACQDNYYSQEFLDADCQTSYLKNNFSKEEEATHNIRKLTPWETLKLQGFDNDFFINSSKAGVSNHQLYKQAGNAVSVNTVYTILDYIVNTKNATLNPLKFTNEIRL
ncbi:MAG: DNA-cytosine methyltransferase (EC [uncultured Sulfurovum sp.]|uniref:Cytosine-specific methyltransferase n=1 Tax=uncultured Sulfurovum sp. TaxID=269237 RepID=A0A6S6S8H0_9BACT|nr:MAG: DNA-cytosine methyltransferase (EC [uncultured Sulfurovum sp.]